MKIKKVAGTVISIFLIISAIWAARMALDAIYVTNLAFADHLEESRKFRLEVIRDLKTLLLKSEIRILRRRLVELRNKKYNGGLTPHDIEDMAYVQRELDEMQGELLKLKYQ